jgi:hypothetical protein
VGLIRKTLAVSTLGLVRGSSKKQRVAKAQLNELRTQTRLMQDQATADPADPLDSPVPAVRAAEKRRIDAQNEKMRRRPTERELQVDVLWRLLKDGVLTKEQYAAAYAALGQPSASA